MDVHKNARTTPHSRALIAQRVAAGERPAAVARAVGVCDRTVHKWVARAAEGPLALEDRSCRPHRSPRAISAALMVEIERARQRRWTGAVIAEVVGLSRATVARTLRQLGLARLPAIEPTPTGRRYEWERPGQLVHVDIKKLAASAASATASPGIAASGCAASAGSSCTSASMIARGWPMPKS
jgi:transposase